ncbi:type III secretion system needle length regulator Spa32 [Shigella flexneri]|nr:type III secretion system needle length regulator Spa32 [Shigella flexneri]
MALDNINLNFSSDKQIEKCEKLSSIDNIDSLVLKKKRKVEIPEYSLIASNYFTIDKHFEHKHDKGEIYSGIKNAFELRNERATYSDIPESMAIKENILIPDQDIKAREKINIGDMRGLFSYNKSGNADKNFERSHTSSVNPDNLLESDNRNGQIGLKNHSLSIDKNIADVISLLNGSVAKSFELPVMNKNTADITPSMSLQEKSIVENDKNVFQKNSEMTYHFKQWGAGHSVSISVESGSFVLKPSDQFVGNKLDLILKQDAEGNYRFDSSQHNKGNKNNSTGYNEQSEEEC